MQATKIAELCHEVNRAFCRSIGDDSQLSWDEAPEWQKQSALNGVIFHQLNESTPEQSHEKWMADKVADGWVYGEVKDSDKKEHPCIVQYDQLPLEQRTKDYLFKAIVDTCNNFNRHISNDGQSEIPKEEQPEKRTFKASNGNTLTALNDTQADAMVRGGMTEVTEETEETDTLFEDKSESALKKSKKSKGA